jgi:hypothetical protein
MRYDGDYKDGKRAGKGVLTLKDGTRRQGTFVAGALQGDEVVETYPAGEVYKGGFANNKRHGKGQMLYPDGRLYVVVALSLEADCAQSVLEEHAHAADRSSRSPPTYLSGGALNWLLISTPNPNPNSNPHQHRYEGDFSAGKKHGQGKLSYVDGRCYEGGWEAGVEHGIGTVRGLTMDSAVLGLASSGCGCGTVRFFRPDFTLWRMLLDPTQCSLQANMRDQEHPSRVSTASHRFHHELRRNTEGVEAWPDGDQYEGEFSHGTRHGQGKMSYSDGDVDEGQWNQDQFVEPA